METELWDVEVDAGYTLTGRARNSVTVDQDVTLITQAGRAARDRQHAR